LKVPPLPSAREIPLLAFYVALVAVSTIMFTVYVPATRGYFNIGEAAVFTVALLSGRYFGAVAGGLGSALADILLGYYVFAPATLVVKGLEGGLLGYLAEKTPHLSKGRWIGFSLLVGVGLFLSVFLIGSTYYTGTVELSLFGVWPATLEVSPLFWGAVAAIAAALVISAGLLSSPEVGWLILSAMISGLTMVTGYFLYEQFILGFAAVVEVPFNLGQVIVGILLAVPIYKSLKALRQRTK
jgi:uncharacterized membrane protein